MTDNMLIDGLIKFCDEKSKNIKLKAEPQVFVEIKQALEELKEYKLKEFQCHLAQQEGITIGYNKAIDEYMNKLCDKCLDMKNECYQLECPFCDDGCDIVNIAEQMKGEIK